MQMIFHNGKYHEKVIKETREFKRLYKGPEKYWDRNLLLPSIFPTAPITKSGLTFQVLEDCSMLFNGTLDTGISQMNIKTTNVVDMTPTRQDSWGVDEQVPSLKVGVPIRFSVDPISGSGEISENTFNFTLRYGVNSLCLNVMCYGSEVGKKSFVGTVTPTAPIIMMMVWIDNSAKF